MGLPERENSAQFNAVQCALVQRADFLTRDGKLLTNLGLPARYQNEAVRRIAIPALRLRAIDASFRPHRLVMVRERRGFGVTIRGTLLSAFLLTALSGCTALVGGGALLAVVTVGALTSHCYDYLDVSVFDEQGRKTCAATVTATNGGDRFELKSCYYAPLTDGTWTLRASLPGYPDALSTVQVEHANDCTRHVQSVELTLNRVGAVPRTLVPANSSPNVPSESPAPAPAPAPGSPTPSVTPAPAISASSSVGVFPDQVRPLP